MDERFDELARDASSGLSRRQTFARVGGGLFFALLASLGLTGSSNDCAKACAECCNSLDFPPRSPEHGACLRDCHQGLGPCGPVVNLPIVVCPHT